MILLQTKSVSAYELMTLFQAHFQQTISPMSAYRILTFLESNHLVHKINITNTYIACAYIGYEHNHQFPQFLVCRQCQRVTELDNNAKNLANISLKAQQKGYQLSSPQIELSCVCNDCL